MQDQDSRFWVATAPVGAASVLAEELAAFGATDIKERATDVRFQGSLEVGYRACLWSRSATRVLLSLGLVDARSSKALYEGARAIDWREHFSAGATLACDCTGGNESIKHTVYGGQLLKDAVCDALRDTTGTRPDVRTDRPDVLLHLHVEGAQALLLVDFSGESLHRRGYREEGGRAPLKENLAAAILLRAGWPALAAAGAFLVDPMCGSGTFLTEGAMIAGDIAPGGMREYWGFEGWRGHDAKLWRDLLSEAWRRRAARSPQRCIIGYDVDAEAVRMSLANADAAGVSDWVHVEKRDIRAPHVAPGDRGLLVVNPPYGERIGDETMLPLLYQDIGRLMRESYAGWQAAVFTGNPPLARHLGVYAKRSHRFLNGAIDCRLLRFDSSTTGVSAGTVAGAATSAAAGFADAVAPEEGGAATPGAVPEVAPAAAPPPATRGIPKSPEQRQAERAQRPGAQMFANRLRKNLQRWEPWAARNAIEAFRVYDADMPEYAFAIDCYGREPRHVFVQEYAPPKTVDADKARDRRREVLSVLPEVFGVPLQQIHSRVRRPQKGKAQYEARGRGGQRMLVHEGGLKFWVNFTDYLDTGLFLDHRLTRERIRGLAAGADFLNLFCYTASATVYAAAGGARHTVSVDLSHTYLQWARDNLELNGFGRERHELLAADCLEWLQQQAEAGPAFDLIFLDPPTFSNSKRMSGVLDVQRDHGALVRGCLRLLRPAGRLIFSTNFTRFRLETALAEEFAVEDISAATIPADFERNPKIHRCYVIRHKA